MILIVGVSILLYAIIGAGVYGILLVSKYTENLPMKEHIRMTVSILSIFWFITLIVIGCNVIGQSYESKKKGTSI